MAYRYKPLLASARQTRIFVQERNSLASTIQGYFMVQSLDALVKHDAFSYIWGENRRDNHILCEGKSLPVTASLYAALEAYLRVAESEDTNLVSIWGGWNMYQLG
jgi:hypothetical protein